MAGFKSAAVLLNGALLFVSGTSASAASVAPTVTPPTDASQSMSLAISGHITPKCAIDAKDVSGDFGTITDARSGTAAALTLSLPFSMSCNSPFEAMMVSQNGALRHEGETEQSFARAVDYSASLNMGRIAGGAELQCSSADMQANGTDSRSRCRASSSKDVSAAAGDGKIELRLVPGALPLEKGTYSDSIMLKLTPRVSG